MKLIIRSAEEKDVQAILDILNHEIIHSTSLYEYEPRSYNFQLEWFRQKQADGWPVLVAELEKNVVGMGTFGTFRARAAYRSTVEHSIYINHEMRAKGIGHLLMQRLISLAKDGGYHTMIGGIDAANEGSIAFHRRYGFKEVGHLDQVGRKFERWLDLVFMQLIFDSSQDQNRPN
jgi:L-amino acid N-acyltransferase YncA